MIPTPNPFLYFNMNLAGIMSEDFADSTDGLCLSLWFNGCDIRCKGCHNKQYWDVKNEIDNDQIVLHIIEDLEEALEKGYPKSLSILGGEPLSLDNRGDCYDILLRVRRALPTVKIRLWTGRTEEQLLEESKSDPRIASIMRWVDEMIVGPFIEELKDLNLPLRGSSNQKILKNSFDYRVDAGKLFYIER